MFKASTRLRSFIIDTEIVAIDILDGSLRTFQELSNRPRKDVRLEDVQIRVCVFAFDLMYLNEQVLNLYRLNLILSVDSLSFKRAYWNSLFELVAESSGPIFHLLIIVPPL